MSTLPYFSSIDDDISEIEKFYFMQLQKQIIVNKINNIVILSKNIRFINKLKTIFSKKNYNVLVFKKCDKCLEHIRKCEDNILFLFDYIFFYDINEELIINLKNSIKLCITDLCKHDGNIIDKISTYCDYVFLPNLFTDNIAYNFPICIKNNKEVKKSKPPLKKSKQPVKNTRLVDKISKRNKVRFPSIM